MPRYVILLLVLWAVAGCSHTMTEFDILATRKVSLGRLASFNLTARAVRGEDTIHVIIVVPIEFRGHDLNAAINKAIDSVPGGVALVEGRIEEIKFIIPFLYSQLSYVVEGRVLVDPARR